MEQHEHKDPVCGMDVSPPAAKGKSNFQGKTYFFCSEKCKVKFDHDPTKYLQPSTAIPTSQNKVEYTCPMHPEIRQLGPGSCPLCGMALEPVSVTLDEEDNSEYKMMLKRFLVSATLSL